MFSRLLLLSSIVYPCLSFVPSTFIYGTKLSNMNAPVINPSTRAVYARNRVSTSMMTIDHDSMNTVVTSVFQTLKHYSPLLITYATVYLILQNKRVQNTFKGITNVGGETPGSMVTQSEITFEDVAGCDYAKKELEEIVDFMRNPGKYELYGAKIPRGVLLSSEPGMGKTLMAKALAGESGVPIISVSASEFVSLFVGNGPKRVKEVYDIARKMSPCFVFIDEIDSVASKRGMSPGGGNDEREATLNQLLTEMDGMNTEGTIITIGATNRPDLLDSAVTRPGRMDRNVRIGSPDVKGRREILNVHFKNKPISSEVDLDALARLTVGMSGASLSNISNEASIFAAREGTGKIMNRHVQEAFDKLAIGIRLTEKDSSTETNRLVSVHETGHALAAYLVGDFDKVSRISIIPSSSGAGGFTLFTPVETGSGMPTKNRLTNELKVLLGGRAAEEIVFGSMEVTTGAFDDIRRAKALCKRIVTEFGMGGPIMYNEKDAEIKSVEILNSCYDSVLEVLKSNTRLLEKISTELIESKEMSGDRFYEMVL